MRGGCISIYRVELRFSRRIADTRVGNNSIMEDSSSSSMVAIKEDSNSMVDTKVDSNKAHIPVNNKVANSKITITIMRNWRSWRKRFCRRYLGSWRVAVW